MRAAVIIALCLGLIACSNDGLHDLKAFVNEAGKGMRGKVEPIPVVKPYEPFTYEAYDLQNPFIQRKVATAKGGSGLLPDLNRKKEALEAFPLENLKMVGMLEQYSKTFAIIKTPDNNLYRVATGNYMGQNFGVVTQVTETEVKLKEIVEDSAGDWTERETGLLLQEEGGR